MSPKKTSPSIEKPQVTSSEHATPPFVPAPTPMELIKIAHAFGLVDVDRMRERVLEDNETFSGWRDYAMAEDPYFRSIFEDAAHIYLLAASVAEAARQADPLVLRQKEDSISKIDKSIEKLWRVANLKKPHFELSEAAKQAGFKTASNFRASLANFGFIVQQNSRISKRTIILHRNLRVEWRKWRDNRRKHSKRHDSESAIPATPPPGWLIKRVADHASTLGIRITSRNNSDFLIEDIIPA